MNIPSYSNQDTSKSANNKNKIVIIAGVAIAVVIIGTVLAFILLKPSDSNTTQPNITDNTEDSEIYAPEFDSSGPEIEIDESPILDVPPEVDWEEPPVAAIYNEEADLNSDGHVEKSEWEAWVALEEVTLVRLTWMNSTNGLKSKHHKAGEVHMRMPSTVLTQ